MGTENNCLSVRAGGIHILDSLGWEDAWQNLNKEMEKENGCQEKRVLMVTASTMAYQRGRKRMATKMRPGHENKGC